MPVGKLALRVSVPAITVQLVLVAHRLSVPMEILDAIVVRLKYVITASGVMEEVLVEEQPHPLRGHLNVLLLHRCLAQLDHAKIFLQGQ